MKMMKKNILSGFIDGYRQEPELDIKIPRP